LPTPPSKKRNSYNLLLNTQAQQKCHFSLFCVAQQRIVSNCAQLLQFPFAQTLKNFLIESFDQLKSKWLLSLKAEKDKTYGQLTFPLANL
jgi:hypothetical protein